MFTEHMTFVNCTVIGSRHNDATTELIILMPGHMPWRTNQRQINNGPRGEHVYTSRWRLKMTDSPRQIEKIREGGRNTNNHPIYFGDIPKIRSNSPLNSTLVPQAQIKRTNLSSMLEPPSATSHPSVPLGPGAFRPSLLFHTTSGRKTIVDNIPLDVVAEAFLA